MKAALACAVLAGLTPFVAFAGPPQRFATDVVSIELTASPVCFALPVSLRDTTACEGLPPLSAGDIDTTQLGLIAAGGLRASPQERESESVSSRGLPLVGLIQIFQVPASLSIHPDATHAERLAADVTKAILAGLPSEAPRGRPSVRTSDADGLVVVRTSVDVDGLTPGTRASFFGHIETATIFSREATYTVVWSGPAGESSAARLRRLADEGTKTMRIVPSHLPAPRDRDGATVKLLAKTLLPIGVVAVAGALLLRRRRGKQRGLRDQLWPSHTD